MASKKAKIRAANKNDIESLGCDSYGITMRAFAIDVDGEAIALAGVMHSHLNQAFSFNTEKADRYPVMKMKLAKKLVELMSMYTAPVYAIASDKYHTSDKLLQHLGFRLDEINEYGRLYKWHGQ